MNRVDCIRDVIERYEVVRLRPDCPNMQNWEDEHKKQAKKYNARFRKMRRTNSSYQLVSNLRSRFRAALEGKLKTKSVMKLIGCTRDELKEYIKMRFAEGMSWDNYGLWHIDHITPCKLFDMEDEEEQRKCFHYTNLQPLWAADNFKKSGKGKRQLELAI